MGRAARVQRAHAAEQAWQAAGVIGGTTARVAAKVSIRASEQPEAAAATYRERCGLTAWSGHQAVMVQPWHGGGWVAMLLAAHGKQQRSLEASLRAVPP